VSFKYEYLKVLR